jgi:tetratricopeptide (TPR) repeat protein
MKKKRLIKASTLLALMFVFVSGTILAQDLKTAISYTKREQYDQAENMFKQLVKNNPRDSKAYFFYGENVLQNYFADTISNSLPVALNEAKEIYNKGVQADTANPLNYVGLAKVAFFGGDDIKAQQLRLKAKSLLPPYKKVKKIPNPKDYAFTLAKIAESYIKDNMVDTSKALRYLREAMKIDKTNPDVYIIAGDIYILVNDGSSSIKYYNLAQDYDPTSPTANMKIGNIYVRGKNLMAAIPFYEKAINLDPNYAPAYRELGQLYSLAGRFEQSKEYFKKYLDLTKGNIPAQIRYVNALFYAKEYAEVIKNVEEIFKVDKSRTYMNRIAAYSCYEMENGDLNQAIRYMETLLTSLTKDRIIKKDYIYLTKILLKKNADYQKMMQDTVRYDRELDVAKLNYANAKGPAKDKFKASVDTLTRKLTTLSKKIDVADKEIDRAFDSYYKALEFTPDDRGLLSEMAANAYAYNRFDLAAKTWEKLIEMGRNSANDYLQVGRAYYRAKDYKKAEQIFNMVVQKWPDNMQAYLMIARTYSQLDPETKQGLAKPKFENLIKKAEVDSVNNADEMVEAFGYLAYYYMNKGNYNTSNEYYDRMINILPGNKENRIRGYIGKANVSLKGTELVKEADEKLPYIDRSLDYYNKVLELDPNNQVAKSSLQRITATRNTIAAAVVPNEIRGVIKNASGQPITGASVRVKDTAAETLTNTSGQFKFQIPQRSEILIFSAPGYKSKEVPYNKRQRVYNITLEQ